MRDHGLRNDALLFEVGLRDLDFVLDRSNLLEPGSEVLAFEELGEEVDESAFVLEVVFKQLGEDCVVIIGAMDHHFQVNQVELANGVFPDDNYC